MNFYGQKNGVFYLLLYTIVYYANLVPQFTIHILTTFKMLLFFNASIRIFILNSSYPCFLVQLLSRLLSRNFKFSLAF